MTDPLGQSQVIPYLQGLSAAGNQVWLISFEKPDRFQNGQNEISTLLKTSGIHWIPQMYTAKPPVISTIRDIRSMQNAAYACILNNDIEVLHCRSYISALVGQSAKKRFGTRFIFDMRGFWADERVDGGIWKLSNPLFRTIYKYFKKKEKQFLLEADQTISLTHNAANEIHSWDGFQHIPITVIPCCADLSLYSRAADNQIQKLKSELGIHSNVFVLSYLGSLGTWYMLPEMMRLFKVLLSSKPDAVFLFITADRPEIVYEEARIQQVPIEQCVVQKAKRNEVPLFASLGDASVFFIRPLYSKKASSPTKMGELMALGMPLICNAGVGDVEEILLDGGNGLILKSMDSQACEIALKQLDSVLKADPEKNKIVARKYYSLDEGVKRYLSVYQKLKGYS